MRLYVLKSTMITNLKRKDLDHIKSLYEKYSNINKYIIYNNYKYDERKNYKLSFAIEDYRDKDFIDIDFDNKNFKVFTIKNANREKINKTWKKINCLENSNYFTRNYKLDIEKHYPNGDVEIYINTKSNP